MEFEKLGTRNFGITVKCQIEKSLITGMFAARIPRFGLTGYGSTQEEAIQDCRSIFVRFLDDK